MVLYISLALIMLCMIMSLQSLFTSNRIKGKWVSIENIIYLVFLYGTIMIGFGLIYIILDLNGHIVLIEDTSYLEVSFLDRLETGFYFSAMTLFSVGYGDIAPIGIGRMIAVIEALVGYVIPTAFVARVVFDIDKKS